MWIAERYAINPRTDEDAAMASQQSARFEKKSDAKAALIEMIKSEITAWQNMRTSHTTNREERALAILRDPETDGATVEGVAWRIREF